MKREFVLILEGVNKTFDGFKAISDLNFYLDHGELRGGRAGVYLRAGLTKYSA